MNDLPRRTLTAILFAAVMIGGIVINEAIFIGLLFIIHTGCLWEYYSLVGSQQEYKENQRRKIKITSMIIATFIFWILITGFRFLFFVNDLLYFLIVPMLLLFFIIELFSKTSSPVKNAAIHLSGICYISMPLSMLIFFPYVNENKPWFPDRCGMVLGMVLLVWVNDTMAYFTGSIFGKHKMSPSISPKKSWEGFFGGIIFAMFAGWILSNYFHQMNPLNWMIVAAIISIFGTMGDFIESMIKRNAGVKDSGNFLPGHGGFLDRFDAFIFMIPFVFLFYVTVMLINGSSH